MAPLFEEIETVLNVTPVTDDIMGRNGAILRRGAEALGVRHGPIRRPVRLRMPSGRQAGHAADDAPPEPFRPGPASTPAAGLSTSCTRTDESPVWRR